MRGAAWSARSRWTRRPVFEFPRLDPGTYHRLPALLADSLPDAFGNALVTHWMRTNGVLDKDITPLDRLAYAGARAMGALEFVPPTMLVVGGALLAWHGLRDGTRDVDSVHRLDEELQAAVALVASQRGRVG